MTETTNSKRLGRLLPVLLCAGIAALGAGIVGSSAAAGESVTLASSAAIAVVASPNPARPGATVTLTNTGSTNPDGALIYDYYQPGVAACATTAANARSLSHGEGFITTLEQETSSGFSDQTQFVPIGGTTYRICAYLYSGGDDSVAPDAVASTLLTVPTRPAATTGAASPVRTHTANVHGRVNPNSAATTYYFQYGRTRSYGSRTASQAAGAGFSSTSVSAALPNLKRHSTYHYRIVATNSHGATPGLDHTLRTGR
jgi:hypothetical protein